MTNHIVKLHHEETIVVNLNVDFNQDKKLLRFELLEEKKNENWNCRFDIKIKVQE